MAIESSAPRSRRAILGAALGGAGALFAHALGRATPVAAANGDPLTLGHADNTAADPTVVSSDLDVLKAVSATGTGLTGMSSGPGPLADPRHSTGVIGAVGDGSGVFANTNETGVYGFADESYNSAGVWGDTVQGVGVVGTGDWGMYAAGNAAVVGETFGQGTGVYGFAGDLGLTTPTPGVAVLGRAGDGATYGVLAQATVLNQYALYVAGRLRLSRSGKVAFTSTATSKRVYVTGITSSSWVIATLQTSISGCYVRNVAVTNGYFTIYLSKAPGKTAAVGYMIVN